MPEALHGRHRKRNEHSGTVANTMTLYIFQIISSVARLCTPGCPAWKERKPGRRYQYLFPGSYHRAKH